MENEDWNPNDWQGRSKKDIEDTLQVLSYLSLFILSIGVGWVIVRILSNL